MPARSYIIIIFAAFLALLALPSFSLDFPHNRFAIYPPLTTVWSGDNTNGTVRSITGVLPGDFKEDNEVVTTFGSYSNRAFCRGLNLTQYRVSIYLDGNLTSGPNSIPASNLKYMLTYTSGIGTKYNYQKYVNFSMAPSDVYLSGPVAIESPSPEQPTAEVELQFKYAIQVPDNQPAGTYTANIIYRGDEGAISATRTTPISITVGSYFRLSVDRGSVDFETMKPGAVKDNMPPDGIIITSKTNVGNPWYLKISNDNPLSSGPYIIPNSNLIWYGWTDGKGTWYGTGTNPITLVPDLIYASGASERNNMPDGTNNHLKFKLTIPGGQPGGKYITNIKLTMTE
jgi:hypothetical protein